MATPSQFLAMTVLVAMAACSPAPISREEVPAGTQEVSAPADRDLQEVVVTGSRRRTAESVMDMPTSNVTAREIHMATAPYAVLPQDRENYGRIDANPVQRAAENPVSTFSVDVDTGAYSNVRRMLNEGRLPPQDAVRVEELINYFDYGYAAPRDSATPFGIVTEIASTPWNPKTRLLQVGIQGWERLGERRPSNLVFLVDVSGSMQAADKLPLVKSSLKLLARQLTGQDRITLVVYAGSTGVVLEPTPGSETTTIQSALDRLEAGGSTNGGAGIALAYAMAEKAFMKDGNNRVLLATDGDFNVGTVSFEALVDLVEEKRKGDVALTTLGFGTGNYNGHLMERLADAGNGNHAYIDSLIEAQRVLVSQRDATLHTIARDVKIQVEFNPARVSEYRLIGYENRILHREDFNNDQIDAGEIGAGHSVTALYEIALQGEGGERMDPLRYGSETGAVADSDELAFVRLRYKRPEDGQKAASRLIERAVRVGDLRKDASQSSAEFRLAAAAAAYGQLLRGGAYTGGFGYPDAIALAESAGGVDPESGNFLQLLKLADGLSTRDAQAQLAPN
ncbi:MAG TPA: VWA domain-containing protein [Steroidobacteraceae bacterium]|nr:VWA domain-containing protein [Steroidobacteraceae bacterium]